MSRLPLREATARTAEERAARAARIRQILGPIDGWSDDDRVELHERFGLAEDVPEHELLEVVRADLLRRVR